MPVCARHFQCPHPTSRCQVFRRRRMLTMMAMEAITRTRCPPKRLFFGGGLKSFSFIAVNLECALFTERESLDKTLGFFLRRNRLAFTLLQFLNALFQARSIG
jgi:hypothetical protein